MELNNKKIRRETFGSKASRILSCIGSAVGVGNIWLSLIVLDSGDRQYCRAFLSDFNFLLNF